MISLAKLRRSFQQEQRRLIRRIDGRLTKARPGSVLILVVALLVLLALMGTAYMETTRVDRHSSVQNAFNTEIDLVIDAVCKIEQQMILNAKGSPPTVSVDSMMWTTPQPDPTDSTLVSKFIGSRIPIADPAGKPIWPYLKAAPLGATFESPYLPAGQAYPPTYNTTTNLQPTSVSVQTASGTVIYPALTDGTHTYMAGSASGSGIADAGLWRLPLGQLNGVTYYGCAFSIDNSSAVNASIAYKPNDVNAALPGDFFPTSIDLLGMLHAGSAAGTTANNQIDALNTYRWNLPSASAMTTPPAAYYDNSSPAGFSFASNLEAMWSQLGRRLDNPGLYSSGIPYQALPIGESMTMAHRYCLMDAAASPSLLEQYLAASVTSTGGGAAIRTSPYGADQAQQWYTDNFDYKAGGGNIRPLLVARNQISNISATRYTSRANPDTPQNNNWNATLAYVFGDWIAGKDGRTYVCVQENTNNPPIFGTPASDGYWALEPWMNYPVKTSINTATFDQLWLAYWGVMSASGPEQPDSASSTTTFRNPIRAAVSVSASGAATSSSPASGGTTRTVAAGSDTGTIQGVINGSQDGDTIAFEPGTYTITAKLIFLPNRKYSGGGSPSLSGIAALTPPQTLRLRAAIAAINSQQLRSDNSQIATREIGMNGAITAPAPGVNTGGATLAWAAGPTGSSEIGQCTGGTTSEFYGLTFTGCEMHFESGAFNVHDNTFSNGSTGIFVAGDHDSHFDHNTFSQLSGNGVYGYPGSNNTYDNNTFDKVWEPIHLVDSHNSNMDVSGNIITNAIREGIELQTTTNGLKVDNNWVGEWAAVSKGSGHMGLSIATGFGGNIEINNNIVLQTGPGADVGSGCAIETFGHNITIASNYSYGWSCLILNGSESPGGLNSTNNVVVGGKLWDYDNVGGAYTIGPVNSSGDRVYGLNDPSAPQPPSAPPTASTTPAPTTSPSTTAVAIKYQIMLYGTGQQPYITEVYANNDQAAANGGMVAVSIYNPYDAPINLRNWRWATVNRHNGVSQLDISLLSGSTTDLSSVVGTLGAHQRILFSSKAAADFPAGIQADPGATVITMPELMNALDYELVLVRPRSATGNLGSSTDPNNTYDETPANTNSIADFVPVDCYDFTRLLPPTPGSTASAEWHYVRPSDTAHSWYFVYPYTYDSQTADNKSPTAVTAAAAGVPTSRLFATSVSPGATITPTTLGRAGAAPADTTYAAKGLPIQVNNTDFGGPKGAAAGQFPFGGFARNGDILQTTFIGAYRIDIATTNADGSITRKMVEYNPVTMDSAFADDLNDNDNQAENVGRFCPLHPNDCGGLFNDFETPGIPSAYHFATRLYDFLTVSGPADDYMQNLGAENVASRLGIANVKPKTINAYSDSSMPTTEDTAPTDGLININTAPWRVLAALPMADNATDNNILAKAIVQYRDGDTAAGIAAHGPFKSIFQLNAVQVPGVSFRNTLPSTPLNGFNPNGLDRGPSDGDLTPLVTASNGEVPDQVQGDFEKQFLAFNRISNLVTVRSDSFTTYVLVQGWRNAGTATPELVVQRRAAFISDRSASIPSNKILNITNMPAH